MHSFCILLTISVLVKFAFFQARYCMYGSFEAGATKRTAQVLYSPSKTYRELHNSLTSFLHCSVVGLMYASLKLLHGMLRYNFLSMIISYVWLCALSCILPLPSGSYLVCLACLSKASALSKMDRLWALAFTPVILMTFKFCQRGATVDTPFLTVLKT